MQGFDSFWKAWPNTTRKGAKSECLKKWIKKELEPQTDQIVKHVIWMCTTDDWGKYQGAFVPAPLVYLNQQRWDGAIVPEEAVKSPVDDQRARWREEDLKACKPSPEVAQRLRQLRGLTS